VSSSAARFFGCGTGMARTGPRAWSAGIAVLVGSSIFASSPQGRAVQLSQFDCGHLVWKWDG